MGARSRGDRSGEKGRAIDVPRPPLPRDTRSRTADPTPTLPSPGHPHPAPRFAQRPLIRVDLTAGSPQRDPRPRFASYGLSNCYTAERFSPGRRGPRVQGFASHVPSKRKAVARRSPRRCSLGAQEFASHVRSWRACTVAPEIARSSTSASRPSTPLHPSNGARSSTAAARCLLRIPEGR